MITNYLLIWQEVRQEQDFNEDNVELMEVDDKGR